MRFNGINCGTCIFAAPASSPGVKSCERYPPRQQYEDDLFTPTVLDTSWCGEWRSAEDFQTVEERLLGS
jgi:hypothetical protein